MSQRRLDSAVFWAIFLVALPIRVAGAWYQSLHLDDFHSLFHARAADLGEFFRVLRLDNHPPLSFLLLRFARLTFGESEMVLRTPAILAGLATIPLVWRLARRLPGLPARAAATCLVAFSSLNLELSSDLRMYALLTLAVTGLLDAVLDVVEGKGSPWLVALWTFVGLHTHYHFVHVLAVVVPAAGLVGLGYPRVRPQLRRLALGLVIAGVASLPWLAWGFRAQLANDLPPGGSDASPTRFLEGMVHMVFLNIRLGGDVLRLLFLASGGFVLGLAGLAVLRLAVRERSAADAPAWWILAAGAFVVPLWSAVVAELVPRAGFEWRYIAGAVTPLALLAARGAWSTGRLATARRAVAKFAVLNALVLSVLNVFDPGREDNRAAVRSILARSHATDGIVAAEWQPRLFPHSGAWNFYAPRLLAPGQELPRTIPHLDDFSLPPGTDLAPYDRVFFLGRSIPRNAALLRQLRKEFHRETAEQFGFSIFVIVFERGDDPAAGR